MKLNWYIELCAFCNCGGVCAETRLDEYALRKIHDCND